MVTMAMLEVGQEGKMGETIQGQLEIQDSGGTAARVTLNGDVASVSAGGGGGNGEYVLMDDSGNQIFRIGRVLQTDTKGKHPVPQSLLPSVWGLSITTPSGVRVVWIDENGELVLGGPGNPGRAGSLVLTDNAGHSSFRVLGDKRFVALLDENGTDRIQLIAGNGQPGESEIYLRDQKGVNRVGLSVESPPSGVHLFLSDTKGKHVIELGGDGSIQVNDAINEDPRIVIVGLTSSILMKNAKGDSIVLDGLKGDITLQNADCAEEFDVIGNPEYGTVLILDDDSGALRPSEKPYDSTVVGVVSGANDCRPGIVLGRHCSSKGRLPVALMGKVFCKAEANSSPIRRGTLLTTSSLPGHAMAATDHDRAFGAVLGKALDNLDVGVGTIPVLIALQ